MSLGSSILLHHQNLINYVCLESNVLPSTEKKTFFFFLFCITRDEQTIINYSHVLVSFHHEMESL